MHLFRALLVCLLSSVVAVYAQGPAGPANAIQVANSGVTAFSADSNFTINPTTHDLTVNAAFEDGPKNVFDPLSTQYDGGLAAAVAGASGYTPDQVINATVNYAECQMLIGKTTGNLRIPLPSNIVYAGAVYSVINIGQVLLWSNMDFGGESFVSRPYLQHNNSTEFMITGHGYSGSADALTCSNGTTYYPAGNSPSNPAVIPTTNIYIHDIGVAGMGAVGSSASCSSSVCDTAIRDDGAGWFIARIGGYGNGFGGPAIQNAGSNGDMFNLGYVSAQLKGCQSYVTGTVPISSSQYGHCGAVQDDGVDDELDYAYASDAQQQASGHAVGPCYPNCAAIYTGGANSHANHLFGQISDVGIIAADSASKNVDWRIDGTSREGIIFAGNFGGNTYSDVVVTSACTDTSLQSAYSVGTATGCSALTQEGQANQITNIAFADSAAVFGSSFQECEIRDVGVGATPEPSSYSQIAYFPNLNNTTANDQEFCGQFSGDNASGRVVWPDSSFIAPSSGSTGASLDVSGVTAVAIDSTTPVTSITYGVAGQPLKLIQAFGTTGATLAPGNDVSTCSGLAEKLSSAPITLLNVGGYASNNWQEVCNTPQSKFVHLNEAGNGTPSNLSVVDFFGNSQARQVPLNSISASQVYGPYLSSGQYCFRQETDFADGSKLVTPDTCTTVNVASATGGEIFVVGAPQATNEILYLSARPTGSSLALGAYSAPTGGFWAAVGTLNMGGSGSAVPPASENTTGTYLAPYGVTYDSTGTQVGCSADLAGRTWLIPGNGSNSTPAFQVCGLLSNGSYAWLSLASQGAGTATFAVSSNVGTGATLICTSGHVCDSAKGTVTLTTGTGTLTAGVAGTVNTGYTLTNSPTCSVSLSRAASPYAVVALNASASTTTGIVFSTGAALSTSTSYTGTYICAGN